MFAAVSRPICQQRRQFHLAQIHVNPLVHLPHGGRVVGGDKNRVAEDDEAQVVRRQDRPQGPARLHFPGAQLNQDVRLIGGEAELLLDDRHVEDDVDLRLLARQLPATAWQQSVCLSIFSVTG